MRRAPSRASWLNCSVSRSRNGTNSPRSPNTSRMPASAVTTRPAWDGDSPETPASASRARNTPAIGSSTGNGLPSSACSTQTCRIQAAMASVAHTGVTPAASRSAIVATMR